MKNRRILLLSGPIGSGKSSVASALRSHHDFHSISSGAYLRSLEGAATRKALQDLGDQLDLETDFNWIVEKVALPTIEADSVAHKWILDSVRKKRQIEHFRRVFGPTVRHVHILASEDALRNRSLCREDSTLAEYEAAVRHANELAARALSQVADEIYDSSAMPADSIAESILRHWKGS